MSRPTVLVVAPLSPEATELITTIEALGLRALHVERRSSETAAESPAVRAVFIELQDKAADEAIQADAVSEPTLPHVALLRTRERTSNPPSLPQGYLHHIYWPWTPVAVERVCNAIETEHRRQRKKVLGELSASGIAERLRRGQYDLPEMPAALAALRDVLAELTVETKRVVEALEADPAMVARMLTLARSAAFTRGRPVADIADAVTRLGNRTVHALAVAAALEGLFRFHTPTLRTEFATRWPMLLSSAALCRSIARVGSVGEPDAFYLLGLLHDIGELLLLRLFDDATRSTKATMPDKATLAKLLHGHHCLVGEGLVRAWALGEKLALAIRHHHEPDPDRVAALGRTVADAVYVVQLADRLIECDADRGREQAYIGLSPDDASERLGLTAAQRDALRSMAPRR